MMSNQEFMSDINSRKKSPDFVGGLELSEFFFYRSVGT